MEAASADELYQRSVDKNLRYIPFIGDGDSKAYNEVCQVQPYGPAVFIPKEECVSNVTKRMGTALRALTKEYKGRKLSDGKGLTGKGRLTVKRIDKIQDFYGLAIRRNKGDAKEMAKATQAIIDHYSSTPESPQHDNCPTGADSWCSYQVDLARNTKLHKPIKDPFPTAIREVMQPIFDRLGTESFLANCENCMTQNANESLHHVIWSVAPKDSSNSTSEISIAISMGVLLFNRGFSYTYSKLLPSLGIDLKPCMLAAWQKIDDNRLYMAEYNNSEKTKLRRKKKKRKQSKKQDAFVHAEGITYKSQAFYSGSGGKKKGKKNQIKRGKKGKKGDMRQTAKKGNKGETRQTAKKGKKGGQTAKRGRKGESRQTAKRHKKGD